MQHLDRTDLHGAAIAPDAILEVAPPVVARRSLLLGGGLGVAALSLPSAIGAASVPSVQPTGGAFSYPEGSVALLHWTAFDTIATPTSVAGVAGSGITDVSGSHGRGGTGAGAADDPRVAVAASTKRDRLATGTITGTASGATVTVHTTLAGVFSGAAGNLAVQIVSSGDALAVTATGGTLTINLGGAVRSASDVAAAINAISGLQASGIPIPDATGTFTVADASGSYAALSGGADDVPDDSQWSMRSTTSELTLTGGSASPYLEWTITNGSATALTVSTLVIHRLRSVGPGPLNLAFYTSTDGFASAVLRRTATFDDVTRHLVVTVGSGAELSESQTLTVRAFPYGSASDRVVRLVKFSSNDGGITVLPLLSGPDNVQTAVIGDQFSTTSPTSAREHISSFIGRFA